MSQTKLEKLIWPIMFNAKQVKDGIGVYQAIAEQAHAINATKHANFFAITQKSSIDAAVLGIGKIFDKTSPQYAKHTLYELLDYFGARLNRVKPTHFGSDNVDYLQIPEDALHELFRFATNQRSRSIAARKLHSHVKELLPYKSSNSDLKMIIEYRHKFVAHQEQLTKAKRRMYHSLPRTQSFINLAELAEHICSFVIGLYCDVAIFPHSSPCAKMSTLNILAKALNKNFDDMTTPAQYAEWRKFYNIQD